MGTNANDFTQGGIAGKLLKFMLPVLGALILQAMYGAVDILVVGWFGTTAGISGVSTGSNIVNLVTFTVTGLSMGITVLIGRYIGEKKEDRVGKVIGGAICFFIVLSVIISIIMLTMARPLAILMQAPEEAIDLTVTYVRICGGGIIFIVLEQTMSSILHGLGKTLAPAIALSVGVVVKLLLNLYLVPINPEVFFLGGTAGAAFSTVMCHIVAVFIEFHILRKNIILKLDKKKYFIKPMIAVTIMGIIAKMIYIFAIPKLGEDLALILTLGMSVICYCILLIILQIFSKEEIYMIPFGKKIYEFFNRIRRNQNLKS